MLKKQARKYYNKQRQEVTYTQRLKWDDLILINFQSIEIPFLETVFSFYPMEERSEVNVFLLTDFLHFRNPSMRICYPKMQVNAPDMEAIACSPDTIFEANSLQILEPLANDIVPPEEIDLVIVPMLICDLQGARVGYGKGYYDRYLSRCRKDCIRVGVSYFEPVDKIEDADEFDVPLDFCITPLKAYVF